MPTELTYKRAAEVFRYDPGTGKLLWRVNRGTRARAGAEAGGVWRDGRRYYRRTKIDSNLYLVHRVVWILHHGEWPNSEIDHIDGDGLNNRIDNLRDVDRTTNHRNSRMQSNNTSGVNGVCWHKREKKWQAMIRLGGKVSISLGYFHTLEEAAAARAAANVKYGYTERHGH